MSNTQADEAAAAVLARVTALAPDVTQPAQLRDLAEAHALVSTSGKVGQKSEATGRTVTTW